MSISNNNFGPLIAYLVPGATVLVGLSPFSLTIRSWLATTPPDAPTIGGFLYLTLASLALGMTVSAVRWALIDALHHLTGVPYPSLNFGALGRNVDAYVLLIEIHYRHYLFYANMVVELLVAYVCYRVKLGGAAPLGWPDVGVLLLEGVFLATSRDTLRKYYDRSRQLLSAIERDPRPAARRKSPAPTVTAEAPPPARTDRRNPRGASRWR